MLSGGRSAPERYGAACSRTHLIGSRQCRRTADLVELQAVERGSANWKKVLGALKAGHGRGLKYRMLGVTVEGTNRVSPRKALVCL